MNCKNPYQRGADFYYSHAAFPRAYDYNWKGIAPMASGSRASLNGWEQGYPVAMSIDERRRSVLHSGPEQTRLALSGLFDFSQSEGQALKVAAIAGVAFLLYKNRKKIKKALK